MLERRGNEKNWKVKKKGRERMKILREDERRETDKGIWKGYEKH